MRLQRYFLAAALAVALLPASAVRGQPTVGGGIYNPAGTNATTVLNTICTTRGALLFHGASAWQCRTPGTSGLFLQSQGAGADPAYAAALIPSNNLSDVSNAATARSNLGALSTSGTAAAATAIAGGAANRIPYQTGAGATGFIAAPVSSNTFLKWDGAAFAWAAGGGGSGDLVSTNNLSDVASASTAWTNLGGGASGKHADSYFLQASNNLSDLASASTARTNLGVTATGGDTTYAFRANNLSDLASASTARTNLGVTATGGDTTYAFRANNLSDLANAGTARTNLGLGTAAVMAGPSGTIVGTSDSQTLSNKTLAAATITGAQTYSSTVLNEAQGADIASATTTDICAATGNYVKVTGTTTITGLGTCQAGTRRIVAFAGALLLTYNATSLILPGAASITTVAGDAMQAVSLGSGNWKVIAYTRQDGSQLALATGALVQRVAGEYTANADLSTHTPGDDTPPQISEGTQVLSLAITTKTATNVVNVRFKGFVASGGSPDQIAVAVHRNGSTDAICSDWITTSAAGYMLPLTLECDDSPGSAATHTYTFRVGGNGTTVRMNGTTGGRYGGGTGRTHGELLEYVQ